MYTIVDDIMVNNFSKFVLSADIYNDFMTYKPELAVNVIVETKPEPAHDMMVETKPVVLYQLPSSIVEIKKERSKQRIFTPEQDDTLFWCLFIHRFGEKEYNIIGSKYKNHEIKEKMKIVDYLIENKSALKSMKITKSATQEIMGKLMTNSFTDLQVVHGICAYYKLHVIVVSNSKKSYIEYDYSENDVTDENDILVIYKSRSLLSNSRCKYSIKFEVNTKDIINDFVRFVSFDKPFNGISTYKLPDLEIIHEKLGLEIIKKNKIELFSQINLAVA